MRRESRFASTHRFPVRASISPASRVLPLVMAAAWISSSVYAGTVHDPREVHLADVVQLTHGIQNAEGYWSPDGKQLIFQSTRPPYACDQMFTMSIGDPDHPHLVSTGKGRTTCGYFTPAMDRILFSSTHLFNAECPPQPDFSKGYVWRVDPDSEIFTAKPDGSDLVRLTDNRAYDAETTVCPLDGTLLFTSTRDGDLDLYTMKPDGTGVKRITNTPGYDGGAFFSADCKQIVWRASRPRGKDLDEYRQLLAQNLVRPTKLEIWVANADGTNARQVTRLGAASFAPYFFPDGKRIVFASNYGDPQGREFDLWEIGADGTGLERITFTDGFDGFPMFSPDGTRFVFASNRNQAGPHQTDLYLARWIDRPAGASAPERSEDRFKADVTWLADPARDGRGVGTQGLAAATGYLEKRFRDLGLAPGGDAGSFRQPFDVVTEFAAIDGTLLAIDGKEIARDEFVPLAFSLPGPVEADAVDAGFGITAADKGYDDYAKRDVRGKVAVVRRFVPKGDTFAKPEDERRWSDLRYKAWNAREHGAVAVLFADLPPAGEAPPEEAPLPKLGVDQQGDAGIVAASVKRDLASTLVGGGHRVRLAVVLDRKIAQAENVVARVEAGAKETLPGVIVVGAHYDHLGYGGPGSLAPDSTAVHPGADDNASGTAALLEVARALEAKKSELRRPVVLVAFSGEERGLLGSTAFTRRPPAGLALAGVRAMINMDMVGRMRDEKIAVLGAESADEWKEIVGPACDGVGLDCTLSGDGYGPSDQTPFYAAGIPVVFLFTGTHEDYHKPSDTADKINATGGAEAAELAADIALAVADRSAPLTYRTPKSPPPARGDLRSGGASLGTIPDYTGPGEGKTGVLFAGVRPDGPADRAGLRRGDVLVELNGKEIRDVNDFMYVLRQAKPGDKARAVVIRDGQRLTVDVVFGERRM